MNTSIQPASLWEDGLRTDPQAKSFEWWYFDSQLTDGSTIVVTFFTKPPSDSGGPPKPSVAFTYTTPDGKKHKYNQEYTVTEFSAAKEKCDVKIGPNTFSGDLKKYHIHIEISDVVAEIELEGIAPAFHTAQDNGGKPEYFGWFSAVPFGKVKINLTQHGQEKKFEGTGYHDHNWGRIDIKDVCDYWYWGRANAGEYSIIFSVMYLPKILGGKQGSVFYLAKDKTALVESSNHIKVTEVDITPPRPKVGHLPKRVSFAFEDGDNRATFTLSNPTLIESENPRDGEKGLVKILDQVFSKPLYVRYTSDIDLRVDVNGKKDEKKGHAIYEIMILH